MNLLKIKLEDHPVVVLTTVMLAATVGYCMPILSDLDRWGWYDWDLFFFHAGAHYRSVVEFGELPLWNPWYLGGFPSIGNPQAPFLDPWFVLDLLFGFVRSIRLRIAGHVFLGLTGMYWLARQMGLSWLAAAYAAGTFIFSTWLTLHLHTGHQWVLGFVYVPWTVGLLHRSVMRRRWSPAVIAAFVVALLIVEGGGAHVLTLLAIVLGILSACWAIQASSLRPVAAVVLVLSLGVGLAGVKSLPAWRLLRENPRQVEDDGWARSEPVPAKPAEKLPQRGQAEPDPRWVAPRFVAAMLLARSQRSNTREWSIQRWDWHEYGCYLGPLCILMLAGWPLAARQAWPWAVLTLFCAVIAAGSFAWFAPWRVLHRFPVLSNMRVPSRFIIPFAFAACIAAGFALDAIWRWLATWRRSGWRLVAQAFVAVLVAISLADSFDVGNYCLWGTFPIVPNSVGPRLPAVVSVNMVRSLTPLMLSNYCAINAHDVVNSFRPGEVIQFPQAALAREEPGYRGEVYLVSEDGEPIEDGEVTLIAWSPCGAQVEVDCRTGGLVVLNRNWHLGWTADSPHEAVSHKGLIAARVAPGRSRVAFHYRPVVFAAGAVVSLVSLVASIALLVWEKRGAGILASDASPVNEIMRSS